MPFVYETLDTTYHISQTIKIARNLNNFLFFYLDFHFDSKDF